MNSKADSSTIANFIKEQKFADAWAELKTTHSDSSATSAIKKAAFCMKYFAHTKYHQQFYFQNIDATESLLDYRLKAPAQDVKFEEFNPETALKKARLKYPNDFNIHYSLGTYYYDVYLTYGNEWVKGKKELMALFYYHFNEAYGAGIKTALSTYAISLYYQSRKTFATAQTYLMETIAMDPEYAPAHYNLAFSYALADSGDLAIEHAKKAYEHYKQKKFKADAASMCGILYSDATKYEDAVNWLLISDALAPGNVHVYQTLLKAYLFLNKESESFLITKNLYYFDWKSGAIFNNILDAYLAVQKQKVLNDFLVDELKLQLNEKSSDKGLNYEYLGFINLHLCQLNLRVENKLLAQVYLDQSTSNFSKAYDKSHSIFSVLDRMYYSINK